MDAGMQYLNDQGIDIVSYAGGTVKVDKMPVAGTPDSGGQIMYLLNVDNYMTMPTGGSEQDMGVSSPEEVEEFKYRVSEALKESNLPPRISDLLYHSLGPADTEGQARGFFDPNSHRTSPPLSPGVDPAGNTPNTFTPPPPVTPNANPAAPMPALPAPAGGDDPAFDAVFGPALDQEKRRRDEINRQIRDRDTTHYKEYDVD